MHRIFHSSDCEFFYAHVICWEALCWLRFIWFFAHGLPSQMLYMRSAEPGRYS